MLIGGRIKNFDVAHTSFELEGHFNYRSFLTTTLCSRHAFD